MKCNGLITICIIFTLAVFAVEPINVCSANSSFSSVFKSKDEKIDAIYRQYEYERGICKQFVAIIARDPEFMEKFEVADFREGKKTADLLKQSKYSNTDVMRYLIRNGDYVAIDVSYHPSAGSIHVKGRPIYCFQTDKRLKELESLGASDKSWELRKHFLELLLKDVVDTGMPWYEGPEVMDFTGLKEEFAETKKTYQDPAYRKRLVNWVDRAALKLRRATTQAKDVPAGSRNDMIRIVESWIAELNKGIRK